MNEVQHLQLYTQPPADVTMNDIGASLWRRRWLFPIMILLGLAAALLITNITPKTWRAEAQLVLVQRPIVSRTAAEDPSYQAPISETVETQIGMLATPALAERTLDWLKNRALITGNSAHVPTMQPGDLERAVTLTNPKDSNLINVSVDAQDRDQAVSLTNALIQSFVQWKDELAEKDVQKTIATLEVETKIAKAQMNAQIQKQTAYEKANHVIDPQDQQRAAIEQLTAREADVAALQQDKASQQARLNVLAAQLKALNAAFRTNGVQDNTLTLNLQTQLTQAEMDRANMAQTVTPAYPNALGPMDARIADLKRRLARAIGGTVGNQGSSLPVKDATLQDYKQAQVMAAFTDAKLNAAIKLADDAQQKMDPLPQTGAMTTQLARGSDLAITHYTTLQSALDSARLEKSKINGNIQITQSATAPLAPYRPSLILNLVMGALLGLFLSVVTALLLEQTDHKLRRDEQVEQLGAGTLLGALPLLSRTEIAGLSRGQLPPPAAEACGLMQANLQNVLGRSLPRQCHVVLITSALPGEGKSVTAVEFARSLARTGKQIILVDANLRQPSQDKFFSSVPTVGLTEVLAGKIGLDEALTAAEDPNLHVLFSGSRSDNAIDFIASTQMSGLIKDLRSRADMVIIDAPACSFADPLILAPASDYVMVVVGLGRADEEAVRGTVSALSGSAPVGLFINRTKRKKARAYETARAFNMTEALSKTPANLYSKPAQPETFERTIVMRRDSLAINPGRIGTGNSTVNGAAKSLDLPVPANVKDKQ